MDERDLDRSGSVTEANRAGKITASEPRGDSDAREQVKPKADRKGKTTGTSQPWHKSILPAPAIITGFVLSALIGYFVKDYLDQAKIDIEISSIDFSDILDPDTRFLATNELTRAYEGMPITLQKYSEDMSAQDINSALLELSTYADTLNNAIASIEETKDLMVSWSGTDPESFRNKIVAIVFNINGNSFEMSARQTLRKKGIVARINSSPLSDPLHKYLSHPPEWADSATAMIPVDFQVYDLSEIILESDASNREKYEALADNIVKRLFIYLDRDLFIEVLTGSVEELSDVAAAIGKFRGLLEKLKDESTTERVIARTYVSNRGQRAASVDPIVLLQLSVGSFVVSEKAVLADDSLRAIKNPLVVPPNSTTQLNVLLDKSAKEIAIANTNLSEFRKVSSAQVIEGRIGAYVRNALGEQAITSGEAFKMGTSAEEEQLRQMQTAF
jgi:hypothetical protein